MDMLSNEQKQILFDHCIGLTNKEEAIIADELIKKSKEAAALYSKFKATFLPLGNIQKQDCPEYLVERTLVKVNNFNKPSNKQLSELLNEEQKKTPIKIGFLSNFSEIAAIAAAVILIAGVLVPTFGYARSRYFQQKCQTQLGGIFEGFRNYINDNDGKQPFIAKPEGAFWWMIGDEKRSNTSHMYLLVAKGYAKPSLFICPGKKSKQKVNTASYDISKYNDFPGREYVNYSFSIKCPKSEGGSLRCRKVLISDSNPIFEDLPNDYSKTIQIELKKELLNANSLNHNGRGQNITCGDGSVDFHKTRKIFGHDDIFTLEDTDTYKGNERPSCSTDQFLAP